MKKLFASLLLTSQVFANELTLYVASSPRQVDWSTPSKLAESVIKNHLNFGDLTWGRSWVELTCGSKHEVTAMTSEKTDYFNKLFLENRGLGILFTTFPGRHSSPEEIRKELDSAEKNENLRFIKFKISEGQCARTLRYLSEYKKLRVGRSYGLAHRPLHGEGASSVSYAVSFPEVLGILDQDMKESWSQMIKVPLALSGSPLREEGVNFFKSFVFSSNWAQDHEDHQKLFFWDPDRIFKWVDKKIKENQQGPVVSKVGKAYGVTYEKSHFPVPESPIWRQQLDPVNRKQTAVISEPSRPPKKNLPMNPGG